MAAAAAVAAVRVLVTMADVVAFAVVVTFLVAAAAVGDPVAIIVPALAWLTVSSCSAQVIVCS